MLNIFNHLNSRAKGIIALPEFEYIKKGLLSNLKIVNNYYRSGAYAVGSDHILVKLLYSLSVDVDTDIFDYYRIVDNKALTVAQQLGFTTQFNKGKIFNNVFTTGNSKDVIMVHDSTINVNWCHEYWKDLRPIIVLRHNKTNIDSFLYNNTVISNGINVYTINLPMLAIQYRAYRHWQKTYVTEDTGRNSIYHFLYSYPILNMIYSSMDYSIFNRIISIDNEIKKNEIQFKHPFHLTNFNDKIDRILSMLLNSIKSRNLDIASILQTFPVINKKSLFESLRLPDVFENRQIAWAIYLARIRALLFIYKYIDKTNQLEKNMIKYEFRKYLGDNSIRSALDVSFYNEEKKVIEDLLKL